MDHKAAADAAQKRLADYIARSAGQHMRAIRQAFERARLDTLARWNRED